MRNLANRGKKILVTAHILKTYTGITEKPCGICFDGQYLWIGREADPNHEIMAYTREGVELYSFPTVQTAPTGIAFDGQYLWHTDRFIDAVYVYTREGVKIKEFDFSGIDLDPAYLAFDGVYLWVLDTTSDKIYMIDRSTFEVLNSFSLPTALMQGMTICGQYICTVHSAPIGGTQGIYFFDKKDGTLLDIAPLSAGTLYGLTYDEQYFWSCDYGTSKIYMIGLN